MLLHGAQYSKITAHLVTADSALQLVTVEMVTLTLKRPISTEDMGTRNLLMNLYFHQFLVIPLPVLKSKYLRGVKVLQMHYDLHLQSRTKAPGRLNKVVPYCPNSLHL